MIKRIAVCLLLLSAELIASDDYAIVFVHLGATIPAYLFDAVAQARLFNDDAAIIVIADQVACDKLDQGKIEEYRLQMISCESLQESDVHKKFKQGCSLNKNFREGFWIKCTERFFYLDELMQQHELHNVFHLEYDNMLYVDLQELLPVFAQYSNVAATFDCDHRCIPGFMYFAQSHSLHELVAFIAAKASQGLDDMHVIASFNNSHDCALIDHLPIIMPEYVEKYGLRSTTGKTTNSPDAYVRYVMAFDSIFDAAALGQFLGGIDPRNGTSNPGFINETCLFNPSKLAFDWELDQLGRKVPYACLEDKRYRINNLHIHSKNLKAFAS